MLRPVKIDANDPTRTSGQPCLKLDPHQYAAIRRALDRIHDLRVIKPSRPETNGFSSPLITLQNCRI